MMDEDTIILTRWDMEDLEKGRTVEVDGLVLRKQTQDEEDADNDD